MVLQRKAFKRDAKTIHGKKDAFVGRQLLSDTGN